jgi:hypothetical protein
LSPWLRCMDGRQWDLSLAGDLMIARGELSHSSDVLIAFPIKLKQHL